MTQVAVRPTRVSDVVKHEYGRERNYERSVEDLVVADDASIGEVYNAADGTIILAADTADLSAGVWILVDDAVYTDGHADAATVAYAVLTGGVGASGAAEVVREGLKFGDALNSTQIDAVVAQLNAQGIRVASQI